MKTCNYCGVELDVDMNYCPLCGHKSNAPVIVNEKERIPRKVQVDVAGDAYDFDELTRPQKLKLVWEITTIVLLSGMVVTTVIDVLIKGGISWSRYSIAAGLFLFAVVSLLVFVSKRPFWMAVGFFVSTSLLLFLIDVFNHQYTWGLRLGIPLSLFVSLVGYVLIVVIAKSKQKGINIIAYALVAAGIMCLFIEGVISWYNTHGLILRWSLIVLICVIPVSGILAYIHFRLKRVTNLKRFFHI
jgi:RNA polymerase subunit RPABC4/transcription elongation factor Spt4